MSRSSRSIATSGISFRTAMLISVVAVLLAVVGVLGVLSYVNARAIVDDLAFQALDQTAARVHDRLRDVLGRASQVGHVHAQRLAQREWTQDDLPALVQDFHDAILLVPTLSYISVGFEFGGYGHVYRDAKGDLEGRIQLANPSGTGERRDYAFVNGTLEELPDRRTPDDYDPRKRGWYQRGKSADGQTWPPVYLFINKPNPDYPGLTCATPVLDPNARVQGVTTADFDLIALGRFLSELGVLKGGVAFVVEVGATGSHRVIAHPKTDAFLGTFESDGKVRNDILPLDQVPDAAVRTLVRSLHTTPAVGRLRMQPIDGEGVRYLGGLSRLETTHDLNWVVGLLVPRDALMAPVEASSRRSLWIGLASLALAGLLVWLLTHRIAKPLEVLAKRTEAIARFELDPTAGIDSKFAELQRLSHAMEEMKGGLRSFGRYVPSELVRNVLASGEEVTLGGQLKELSVCFTDIADFTTISETMDPQALVTWLEAYFEEISTAFVRTGGTVDKYIGDSVMAFWGAPRAMEDSAAAACRGALAAKRSLEAAQERLADDDRPMVVRFGVGTGQLVVGNIGSSRRLNYTVIGDPVNLAARLESLNKMYGTSILVDERTIEKAGDAVVARPVEVVSVKGRVGGTLVYELLATSSGATRNDHALVEQSEAALAHYRARGFRAARAAYEQILVDHPRDGVAFVMAQSCTELLADPPPADWDGIRRLVTK